MTLTFQEAAQILKISPATVRNWLKSGVLKSTRLLHVTETKSKISSGALRRLQKGANKHQSLKIHSHAELLSSGVSAAALKPLIEKYKKQKKELLLAVYMCQLAHAKLAKVSGKNRFSLNPRIKKELAAWNIPLQSEIFRSAFESVAAVGADFSDNLLSYLHQSLNQTSAKQDLGAYYTPASAVKKTLQQVKRPGTVCDPCCGSGNFLVQAYLQMQEKGWPSPETSVFGYDCDPLAVLLARANLTLVSKSQIDVFTAVQQKDFLFEQPLQREFNYILTNPPWGSYSEKNVILKLQQKFGLKKTKDSFSFFVLSSLQTMKHNGSGLFILPVSFMNVAAHTEFRRYLFSNWTVTRIQLLQEKFSGVMTSAILVSVQNRRPKKDHDVEVCSAQDCRIPNSEILKSKNCSVPLNNDAVSLQVLREIEESRHSLKGRSTWGLGLVTGNNEKFLFDTAGKGRVPVIKGNLVFRYRQPNATSFCSADTSRFQQAAPLRVYKAGKKLVYRFISKELVFAIDTKGLFTLNSANILIPESDLYSCEFLCGLFNSKLGQYYFTKKQSSIKVLRSHLENFPLPEFNEKIFSEVEACVLRLQKGYDSTVANRLDKLIVKAYKLSEASQAAVLGYVLSGAFH